MAGRLALLFSLVVIASPLNAAAPVRDVDAEVFTDEKLGLTVLGCTTALVPGRWEIVGVEPPGSLEQAYVKAVPAQVPPRTWRGEDPNTSSRRARLAQVRRRATGSGADYRVRSYAELYGRYADAHGGKGPASVEDLALAAQATPAEEQKDEEPEKQPERKREEHQRERDRETLASLNRSPWPEDADKSLPGPFYFLVPEVPMADRQARERRPRPAAGGEPIVLELRPLLDDGQHWVAFSDGRVERVPVDAALLAKFGLTLSALLPKEDAGDRAPTPIPFAILGLLREPLADAITVTLRGSDGGDPVRVRLVPGKAAAGQPALLGSWAAARAFAWRPLQRGGSPVMAAWAAIARTLYASTSADAGFPEQRGEPQRTTDAFSVLGGRAALRETLQTQPLRAGQSGALEPESVPLESIAGVEVKSHPFDAMLAGSEGGRLALADSVPADRFFAYFAKPAALFPFVEAGGDFLARAGSLFSSSSVDDNLVQRYLGRLGLEGKLGRRFLESGEVLEAAIVAPDLFFLDGTDLSILLRVKRPDKIAGRMKDLGVTDLAPAGITEKRLAGGGRAYWARWGDLLAVSSSRVELEAIGALRAAPVGSLGRSAEFRSMLTRLPLKKETRALLYFSDPFIRRLVGPAVKIGQLRRLRARNDMIRIVAGALLARLDGRREQPDLEQLSKLGYIPPGLAAGSYRLGEDFAVTSPVWGTPAEMTPIAAVPLAKVTAAEQQAYGTYLDQYTRYWRQYFDPVAMRLDELPDGDLELETFILPLLDSQIYNQFRALLPADESAAPLRVPAVRPDPVLLLSLNLTEDAWVKASGTLGAIGGGATGIDPSLFDLFGPGVHLAVQDGDPIVALGNADILGGFSGAGFTGGMMRQGIPLLLSMITRPCKIIVELRDEAAAVALLRRAAAGPAAARRDVQFELRQVDDKDAWILSLGVAGMVKVRLGIEVQSGYLVLSNIPWSQPISIGRGEVLSLSGARLQIVPGAVKEGLPGLFATEGEQNQHAALTGMGDLYPLLATVSATPEDAAARHADLFGARPLHPGGGRWVWKDGEIGSSVYGTPRRWQQPSWTPRTPDFGLFVGVERLGVAMQLEEDGLRTRCRWSWKER